MAGVHGGCWLSAIKRIELRGFKQFDRLIVSCQETNIFVGPNNAGKSSVLDVLRILSDVIRYANRRKPSISNFEDKGVCATHTLEQSLISVSLENVTRNYSNEPARASILSTNGTTMHLVIPPNGPVQVFLETDEKLPRSTKALKKQFPLEIIVVPTLGPYEAEETFLTDETIRRNENTRLAHRNFRNILLRRSADDFSQFQQLVESTWAGVKLCSPEHDRANGSVFMFFEEERITREINWAGFGFQVWLQLMAQILRGGEHSILVLDEPDIYLHADLQHKLLHLAKERFGQCFLATHSTEIVNEANPRDILTIRKGAASAQRITSDKAYSFLFGLLGSSENAEFARMARAKQIVFFEGKDRRIIRRLAEKISGTDPLGDTDTIFVQIEGASQWKRVVNTDWTLQKIFGMEVRIAALFDRDYMTDEEVDEFLSSVNSDRVKCYVLQRKEIENYFLSEGALERAILHSLRKRGLTPDLNIIRSALWALTDAYWHDVQGQIIARELEVRKRKDPSVDPSTTISKVTLDFQERWSSLEGRFEIVPGKQFISDVSKWLQAEFSSSLTIVQIAEAMRKDEVPADLIEILKGISCFFESEQ
jgi:ABC-type multidrug transport system ATPase subunit